MSLINFEKQGKLGWLELNRPDTRNALSLDLMNELIEIISKIKNDESLHVLIIYGNGPAFSSGHDLKELAGDHDESYYQHIFLTCSNLMQLLTQIPQPVIAMVHGAATAAGCQLVASCDLAVASEDAVFSTPGVKIGLFCSTPMVPLVRLIGSRRALDMLLTGRFISAHEAKEFGLINSVVSKDKLKDEVERIAHQIAEYSKYTVGFGKKTFYEQRDLDLKSAYEHSIKAITANCMHDDAKEGIIAKIEKREAKWK